MMLSEVGFFVSFYEQVCLLLAEVSLRLANTENPDQHAQ